MFTEASVHFLRKKNNPWKKQFFFFFFYQGKKSYFLQNKKVRLERLLTHSCFHAWLPALQTIDLRGYSQKSWVGVWGLLHKPLTYLWPKSTIFAPYLWKGQRLDTRLITTITAGTVALNTTYEGLLSTVLLSGLNSSKKHTQFKTIVLKPYPVYNQNGWKTLPLRTAHTYVAHIREYPQPWAKGFIWKG